MELRFRFHEQLLAALEDYEAGYGFSDALIGHIGLIEGCETTCTFGQKAARLSSFSSEAG
ncbi:MAG: hypothetical protein ACFBZ8_07360 [Opitutales bacterium]